MTRRRGIGLILLSLAVLATLGLLAFGWLPLRWLRLLMQLVLPGRPLRVLDLPILAGARLVCGLAGIVGAMLLAAGLAWRDKTRRLLDALERGGRRLVGDARLWAVDLRAGRVGPASLSGVEAACLAAIVLAGAAVRAVALFRPMEYDEAYTVVAFATQSLWGVLSDYSLPNNHVFHTLWVHFSWELFGLHTWSVRLPAFLAGVLLIAAVYGLARSLYGRSSAILAAGLVAAAPLMIGYSTNARGYSILGLVTVLVFWIGNYLKTHANTAAWAGLSLLAALGFFTVPIMLYPFGILFTWLGLSFLTGELRHTYSFGRIVKYSGISGCLTGILTVLLYTPVLLGSGLHALTGNVFIQAEPWARFSGEFGWRMQDAFVSWTSGVPAWVTALAVLGFGLALALHLPVPGSAERLPLIRGVPVQLAALVWLVVVLPIQRPLLLTKVWLFLYPLLLVWVAAGWGELLDALTRVRAPFVSRVLIGVALLGLAVGMLEMAQADLPYLRGTRAWMDEAVLFVKQNGQSDDVILIDYPIDAQFMFYARLRGLPDRSFREYEARSYRQAWVLVDPVYQQSVQTVLENRKVAVPVEPDSLKRVTTIGPLEVYQGKPAPAQ
jgi:4-amino-4-deoxy-L-arabinose transferase-like glycosyltransferase